MKRSYLVATLCFAGLGCALALIACQTDTAAAQAIVCERATAVCPSVQPSSSEDVTSCAGELDGPCGTIMRQYLRCVSGECDDAGEVDRGAAEQACGPYMDAFRGCSSADAGPDAAAPSETEPEDAGSSKGTSKDAGRSSSD